MTTIVNKENIFLKEKDQDLFSKEGYFVQQFLNTEEIRDLLDFAAALPQYNAHRNFFATMNINDFDYRRKVDQKIKSVVEAKVREVLPGYRVLFANYLFKNPGENSQVTVHQDWTYVDEKKHDSVNFWIPLVDANLDNGCLFVFPGSHKLHTNIRYTPYETEPFFPLIKRSSIPVKMKAGEAIIYSSRLYHFSENNYSSSPRPAIAFLAIPREAKPMHYFLSSENGTKKADAYEVDEDFFMTFQIGEKPRYDVKEHNIPVEIPKDIEARIKKLHEKNLQQQTGKAKNYYEQWNDKYMEIYGDVIQALRPSQKDELLNYISESAGLKDGMKIIDAGCGVCGPAEFFAKKFNIQIDAITISPQQVKIAEEKIKDVGLFEKVKVTEGDYHFLERYFQKDTYDAVLFLESLGHAANPAQAIESAFQMLKKGGFIYIKDFFPRETDDPALTERIRKTIQNMNDEYSYNTLDLHETLTALRKTGFAIRSIKSPDFKSDTSVRAAFEEKFNIEVFEGGEFEPAEWLEIKCEKYFV